MEAGAPRKHRSLEERVKIYDGVKKLRSYGKTYSQIAADLDISCDEVVYWLRAKPPHVERYLPDLTPRPRLAYLVGAYLGDGRTAGPQDKKVRFHVADGSFAISLNQLVAEVLRTRPKPIPLEAGYYSVSYDSAALYDYLQEPLGNLSSLLDDYPTKFLQGFFDAEGYASPRLNHSTRRFMGVVLGVANTNLGYLAEVDRLLMSFGIECRTVVTHKPGERMTIRGRTFIRKNEVRHLVTARDSSVVLFQKKIGFSIPQKRDKLNDLIRIRKEMSAEDAYQWFVSHYELKNRRWYARHTGPEDLHLFERKIA